MQMCISNFKEMKQSNVKVEAVEGVVESAPLPEESSVMDKNISSTNVLRRLSLSVKICIGQNYLKISKNSKCSEATR